MQLSPGYAFRSSRKNPREPQTVIVGEIETAGSKWDGWTLIDDCVCNRFRVRENGRTVYYFQSQIGKG